MQISHRAITGHSNFFSEFSLGTGLIDFSMLELGMLKSPVPHFYPKMQLTFTILRISSSLQVTFNIYSTRPPQPDYDILLTLLSKYERISGSSPRLVGAIPPLYTPPPWRR